MFFIAVEKSIQAFANNHFVPLRLIEALLLLFKKQPPHSHCVAIRLTLSSDRILSLVVISY